MSSLYERLDHAPASAFVCPDCDYQNDKFCSLAAMGTGFDVRCKACRYLFNITPLSWREVTA